MKNDLITTRISSVTGELMLNPITYTEHVISDFLRYQVTTYPFADASLYDQMRALLNLEETRRTPLMKGPYITLSKSFRQGASIQQLVSEGVFHPHTANIAKHPTLFGHQEKAVRAIAKGHPTLVSTGTGSGKTEAFLYPIISHCLHLRDQRALSGITAVIVYPMNALAEDQLERLRGLLAGTGITFGMYIGKTSEVDDDAVGIRLPQGSSKADYEAKLAELAQKNQRQAVFPYEERISRQSMRQSPPRILLTNVKQLELLLTRQRDVQLFDGATLDFLVFDEAHTFSGAAGAETAVLIRRLRAFCGREVDETVCIATSATIVDAERGPEAGRDFAARFFGVDPQTVALVGEEYEPDQWADTRTLPTPFPGDATIHLQDVLTIVDANNEPENDRAATVIRSLLGIKTAPATWRTDVYDYLSRSELAYQLAEALSMPRELPALLKELKSRLGREVSEEELLLWLALGAAARKGERPFMRPVVHAFVRGVSGAVVTFPEGWQRPKLWLSAIDAADDEGDYRLNVLTCGTCGQHYFEHFLRDFDFTDKVPGGGELTPTGQQFWRPLEQSLEGNRVVLLDQLVGRDDEDEDQSIPNSQPLFMCAACGTMHSDHLTRCASCGEEHSQVQLWVVKQDDKNPGKLYRCVSCGTNGRRASGGRYREPAKPVRATTVSDVHVLAQNMIQHAQRKRLLVFSDNRQDAAFQAGWMKDHARRFRLRSLMYGRITQGPTSIGDLTAHLDDLLNRDDDLSQSLAPEVWRMHRKQAEMVKHNEQRKYFLRIQVLRELVTGVRQRIGLEPWGRIQVNYDGLTADLPFMQAWAEKLALSPETLLAGVASLLDTIRRKSILLDRDGRIFSRYWNDGDSEIQRGYMPKFAGVPAGLKLTRDPNDHKSRVQQWLSETGHQTSATQAVRSWGVPSADVPRILQDLWQLLTVDLNILVPVTLRYNNNDKPIRGTQGVFQLDADKLRIVPHEGVYRCQTCRRVQVRPTPHDVCMGWLCKGTLVFEEENPDDYDLMVLDQQFTLLRPEEHSAQVPNDKRERLERAFKSETSDWVNTLVATPTLEMGVDIGGLDSILMRNVPPLPSNYWQRAGRAGRRYRMAVNLTYARNASHDRAYFEEPLKLLNGIIYPPRINLRNELMIQKHAHAAVLTVLNQLRRDRQLAFEVQAEINGILNACFPTYVNTYLFTDNGYVLSEPLDVSILATLISRHETAIINHVLTVFASWPAEDQAVVTEAQLHQHVQGMTEALTAVIKRVWKRLQWAMSQMRKLDEIREKKGTLDAAEDALYARCDRLVKKLKGTQARRRSEGEGFDDTYTYGVLAAEGFLPGYGLGTGAIVGTAQIPISQRAFLKDFDLPRSPAIALREYAPGNLIYANGNRFIPRFYHLEPDAPISYQVDIENQAASEIGTAQTEQTSLGASVLPVVPIADVDMPHVSHITDDEDYRFQMPVTLIGYEQQRHAGGKGYNWGGKTLLSRHNVHLRLLNVGSAQLTGLGILGYPISLVSGQSRSPLSSDAELDNFRAAQLDRYGEPVQNVGFSADVIADALSIQDCHNRIEAYSVAEALRMGAANVIDMEVEDLQLLCIGKPGQEEVDILIYDPMPGGSGLLEQILEKWRDVVEAALDIVAGCPSVCEQACIDCLMSYRNAYYHRYLDRETAVTSLTEWGQQLAFTHDIQAKLPNVEDTSGEMPVNEAESRLLAMIQRAGFPTPIAQYRIDLERPLGHTIPDFFYDDSSQTVYEGICIYLDGMSRHIHGNRETQQRDQRIREALRNQEYEVIAIPYTDLADRTAMAAHFYRLGKLLVGRSEAKKKRDNPDWFTSEG